MPQPARCARVRKRAVIGVRRPEGVHRLLALLALLAAAGALAYVGVVGGPFWEPRDRASGPPPVRPGRTATTQAPSVAAPQHAASGRDRLERRPPAPSWRLGRTSPRTPGLGRLARASIAFDLDSGRVLAEHRGRAVLPIASLTKVMTALVILDAGARPDERVRVPRAAARVIGSKVGLPGGRRVALEALLQALLVSSGNDAAVALATHVAGSEAGFVDRMNRRARRLGLRCTRFRNVHGVGPANRSCPRDLARLTREAMRRPRITAIAARATATITLDGRLRLLRSTNPLLRARVAGTIGLKTGWSPSAGRCLAAVVRRGGRRIGIVLLDAPDRLRAARVLLRAAGPGTP